MNNKAIIGTGAYVPKRVVTNNDLEKIVDTSDEWIRSRTGIGNRHITETETTVDLAVEASLLAIEDAGINKEDIDLVIVATVTPENAFPAVSNMVQSRLGLRDVMSFDVNAACSGFVYGLDIARRMIDGKDFKNALVIGSETLTKFVDWTDRNTCVLFGDGAGAMIIGQGEGEVIDSICHSEGDVNEFLMCTGPSLRDINDTTVGTVGYIEMKGRDVFKFATTTVPESITEILERNDLTVDDIDLIVAHQANYRILESAAKRLKVPVDKFFMNIEKYGNTSSASVPLAFDDAIKQGKIKQGDLVCSVAFGGGLTWGSALIQF